MKKHTLGSKEEYFSYLNENSKMDRSLLAFNLQNKFKLGKKEAGNTIRGWYIAKEKSKIVESGLED